MRVAGIVRDSIVDGEGIRDVIFLQGCPHHCKGCHNPNTWNFDGGTEMTIEEILNELADSSNPVTISGGEPMWDITNLKELVWRLFRKQGKKIWLYTGYNYECFSTNVWWDLFARGVDVVVDGRFEQDKKDSSLRFRGSSNQRIIDLFPTFARDEIVLWEE